MPTMVLPSTEVIGPLPAGPSPEHFKIINTHVMPPAPPAMTGYFPLGLTLHGFDELLGPFPKPNGFLFQGWEADVMGGSYGRLQTLAQAGKTIGSFALYTAVSTLNDAGYRKYSGFRSDQGYADLGWRDAGSEIHFSVQGVSTKVQGSGAAPNVVLAVDPQGQLGHPDIFENRNARLGLSGKFDLSNGWTSEANAYFNQYSASENHVVGSPFLVSGCVPQPSMLCFAGFLPLNNLSGSQIPNWLANGNSPYAGTSLGAQYVNGGPYAYLAQPHTDTSAYGAKASFENKGVLFERPNDFVVGVRYDGAGTRATFQEEIGALDLTRGFIQSHGVINVQGVDGLMPQDARQTSNYLSVFMADAWRATDRLTIGLSGRFNYSQMDRNDQNGNTPALTGVNTYSHFNPAVGASYSITPSTFLYAGYSVTNRAPTPGGLTCLEDAEAACNVPFPFFVDDQALKQSIDHRYEVGLRGQLGELKGVQIAWNAGLYRTDATDDTYPIFDNLFGRLRLLNIGETRKQGARVGMEMVYGGLTAFANYVYTDARFRSPWSEFSPADIAADPLGFIHIQPGNIVPLIPKHQIRIGASYAVTDDWKVGAVVRAQSAMYMAADEVNAMGKTPGYAIVSLNTQYRLTKNVEIFGLIDNLLNTKYALNGGLVPTDKYPILEAPGATDPRGTAPGQPFSVYGGLRVRF
ncbi:iron complex outermembrane receptor protein [Bradyrhizobium diazoefficiens]